MRSPRLATDQSRPLDWPARRLFCATNRPAVARERPSRPVDALVSLSDVTSVIVFALASRPDYIRRSRHVTGPLFCRGGAREAVRLVPYVIGVGGEGGVRGTEREERWAPR